MMEEKLSDITANNMKKLTLQKDDLYIKEILSNIKAEAEKGKSELILSYSIKNTIKKALEERGFRVIVGGRYNEVDVNISWY